MHVQSMPQYAGMVVFVEIFVLGTLIGFPLTPMALTSGFLFGAVWGAAASTVGTGALLLAESTRSW